MENYTKNANGNNIVLIDNLNNKKLTVIHNDDDYIFLEGYYVERLDHLDKFIKEKSKLELNAKT